ncbi:nucleotidyltransferase domain-containing protein [Pseudolabrys sp. Root1462]|uniref:nucleotidyltransferase domain-containing protein n=1 Tax=Pseudolabrys sp. Root1462 TaxID=1736466 RepID=UPI0012E36FF2|nr:nucleotidyltransferase domain-containing protein [Pseudolabrys sp. Root1462]
MSSGRLIAAYIFGSVGRGHADILSDLDILAVVKNNRGKVDESEVLRFVPQQYSHLKPSISWYGALRVAEMFRNGELFSWHLYRETLPLFDPTRFLPSLGEPAVYKDCLQDVRSFRAILSSIPAQVQRSAMNAAYEAGLVYVCLRNIAMAASWRLCDRPDFSRYSVFHLRSIRPCPVSVEEFDAAMHCRMASQRGHQPPAIVTAAFIVNVFARLDPWLDELECLLRREVNGRPNTTHAL